MNKVLSSKTLQGIDRHYIHAKDEDLKAQIEKFTEWYEAQTGAGDVDQVLTATG